MYSFLMLFVKETLHLLSINPRLSEMSPSLKVWLEETCAAKSAEVGGGVGGGMYSTCMLPVVQY